MNLKCPVCIIHSLMHKYAYAQSACTGMLMLSAVAASYR